MNIFKRLSELGITSDIVYAGALGSVLLSLLVWNAGSGRDRHYTERRAIFIGLWAPTFMLIGRGLEDAERTKSIVG